MIKKTGLQASPSHRKIFLRPAGKWTFALFKSEFQLGNRGRIRRLTAGAPGFHGAHNAASTPPSSGTAPVAASAAAVTPTIVAIAPAAARHHVKVEGGKMFYCWTHSLSTQSNHTSLPCLHKAEGHQDDATTFHMRGGNNTISSGRPQRTASPSTPSSDRYRGRAASPGAN